LAVEVAALLSAYAEERTETPAIDLLFAAPEGTPVQRAQATREFVLRENPLALVASFTDGADAELAAVADEIGVPLLATLSSSPRSSVAPSAWLRDLCGGVIEQASALVRFVDSKPVALLHTDDAVAGAIARRAGGVAPFDATAVHGMEMHAFGAVLFAGADQAMARVFDEMDSPEHWPALLLAGAALPPSTFDRLRPSGGVWIALPTTSGDEHPSAMVEYLDLVRRHGIPTNYRFSQFAALTSMQLFLDAVRRCGSDLTRQSLLRAVDDTRNFHSGLFPSLTYGEERHIGSTGAWVLGVHKGRAGGAVWMD
jgi:hypothetical protein